MFRIDSDSNVATLPTPNPVGPNPNGYFQDGNEGTNTYPTVLDADWLNALQEELCFAIEETGVTLDKTDRTQLYDAIQFICDDVASGVTIDNPLTADLSVFTVYSSTSGVEVEASLGDIIFDCTTTYIPNLIWATDNNVIISAGTVLGTIGLGFIPAGVSSFVFSVANSPQGAAIALDPGAGTPDTACNEFIDEDSFATNSQYKVPTQQSFKAYADAEIPAPITVTNDTVSRWYFGYWDGTLTSGNSINITRGASAALSAALVNNLDSSKDYYLSDFKVYVDVAPGSGQSFTFNFRFAATLGANVDAGVFTLTIADTSLTGTSSTTYTIDNKIGWQITVISSAGAATINRIGYSFKIVQK